MYELMKLVLVQVNGLQENLSLAAIVEQLERDSNYPSSQLASWLKEEGMELIEQLATSEKLMKDEWQQFVDDGAAGVRHSRGVYHPVA